jgi:hypothetical protein
MELVNQELQLQAGEANVTRGLVALNAAQDYFESLAAVRKGLLGDSTGTVTTSASTETTTFPSTALRIDRLQVLDSNSRPVTELARLKRTGGHAATSSWPLSLFSTTGTGKPKAYWTNGTSIYWNPLPDATYTVRWYGFASQSDITASGTFAYKDIVALPLASFAVQLMKTGVDDDAKDVGSLAAATFNPVLDALSAFNRDGAVGFEYTQVHQA